MAVFDLQVTMRHQGKSRQELKEGRSLARYLWFPQIAFLYQPGLFAQGWHRLQWAGFSHISHESSRRLTDLPQANLMDTIDGLRLPLLRYILGLCQVNKNTEEDT